MKRNFTAIILVLVLTMISLTGCADNNGKKPESKPKAVPTSTPSVKKTDYMQVYEEVIKEYYNIIKNVDTLDEYEEDKIGIVEAAQYLGADALNKLGYIIKDVNGDDVSELLIGDVENFDGAYTANNLYAVYTVKNEKPHFVLSGRSRSAYALMENGSFYYGGSNGAAYRIFGEYELEKNGELKCKDFNFSYNKDDSFEEIGFYHNTTGVYEISQAEEMKISSDEFYAMEESLSAKTATLKFTPFSETKADEKEPENGNKHGKVDTTPLCASWTGYSNTPDGSEFILFVDILPDGKVSYRSGPPESEIMADYNGEWEIGQNGSIVFKMVDSYEDYEFDGTYKWDVNGNTLALQHIRGDVFIYGTEGKILNFTK